MSTSLNLRFYLLALISLGGLLAGSTNPRLTAHYKPVAVLELFTSQGCSSCPSADRLLTETLAEASKTNQPIIGLSFHVDYWNRLGWKDPFSDHAFTKRQYQYRERFGLSSVYTPQGVLNGRQEFVGSNRTRQHSLLQQALSQPATAGVKLIMAEKSANSRTLNFQLDGDLADAVLNVALVSKTAETVLSRGENAGRKLVNNNIVRVFQTLPASAKGTVTLVLPSAFEPENGAVVAYVQGRQKLEIRGAAQMPL